MLCRVLRKLGEADLAAVSDVKGGSDKEDGFTERQSQWEGGYDEAVSIHSHKMVLCLLWSVVDIDWLLVAFRKRWTARSDLSSSVNKAHRYVFNIFQRVTF